jgi:CubicO group peptidase (beta-lactamase class C family)
MKIRTVFICCLSLALSTLAQDHSHWPTDTWPTASPRDQGLSSSVLDRFHTKAESGEYGLVDSVLITRSGVIVFEKSYSHDYETLLNEGAERHPERGAYDYHDPDWHPYYSGTSLHSLQSITKSVTSALIGVAIEQGHIDDTGTALRDSLADRRVDERMTILHLLTMTSGIAWNEDTPYDDPKNDWAALERSENWLDYILTRPLSEQPGAKFSYNSGVPILLGEALYKATGMQADQYAAQYLFEPLGIKNYFWKQTPCGRPDTQGGLYLSPRDLAKIGYLYSRDGVWDGQRLLPKGWVAQSMEPAVDADGWKYGYQWWLLPYQRKGKNHLAWTCLGYGGQRMFVLQEYDLVAVFTAWNIAEPSKLSSGTCLNTILESLK